VEGVTGFELSVCPDINCLFFILPQYCVTLTVGPEFCLLRSNSVGDSDQRSTSCVWATIYGSGVEKVGPFTLLALQPGEHPLKFTLKTRQGARDIVLKTLHVVVRQTDRQTDIQRHRKIDG